MKLQQPLPYIWTLIYLFYYLLFKNLLPPLRSQGPPTLRKETKKSEEKGIELQRVKPLTPTQTTNALIGDEEKKGKRTKRKKRRMGL